MRHARSGPFGVADGFDLLLVLRGLAAVSVVVWHMVGYAGTLPPALNTPGRTAVWLFFGISGYVVAHGFVHRRYRLRGADLRGYALNRILRIYPLFLLLSLLAFVTGWLQSGEPPIGWRDVPAQLFAVQFDHAYLLSGVFWTLGIEIQFYLLAPVLAWLLVRAGPWSGGIPLLYVLVVWAYSLAVTHLGWSFDGRNIVANLPHFLVGMIGCRLAGRGRPPLPAGAALVGGVAILAYTNWLYHARSTYYWSVEGLLLVDAAILLFVLAHGRLEGLIARRPLPALAVLGVLSYGIYGWHAYLIFVLPPAMQSLPVVLAGSVAAAYLSYRMVERPALRFKRATAAAPPTSARRSASSYPPPARG